MLTWMSILQLQISNIFASAYMLPTVPVLAEAASSNTPSVNTLWSAAVALGSAVAGGLISGLITLRVLETRQGYNEKKIEAMEDKLEAHDKLISEGKVDQERCKNESHGRIGAAVIASQREIFQRIDSLQKHVDGNGESVFKRVDASLSKMHDRINTVDKNIATVQGQLLRIKGEGNGNYC